MGLFSRKEVCPVCGNKIKGNVVLTIANGMSLCQTCSGMIRMDAKMIPEQTPEQIREHLKMRELNQKKVDEFEANQEIKAGIWRICVDESQKLWYCSKNKKDENPQLHGYDEIIGCEFWIDGEKYEEQEPEKKGLSALFSKKDPEVVASMKVIISLDNPYISQYEVEMIAPNDSINKGGLIYKSYKNNALHILAVMNSLKNNSRGES